jgi:hypothetical protein
MMKEIASRTLRAGMLALGIAATGGLSAVSAQNAPAAKPVAAAPAAPAAKPTASPANVLSIADIESRMVAQGITITEIELRDLLAEVEGYGADGRKIELIIDRRSGETLSEKVKSKK